MYWKNLFVSAAIAPFGMDMSLPAALVSASDAVPVTEQGTAASLVNTGERFCARLFGVRTSSLILCALGQSSTTAYPSVWAWLLPLNDIEGRPETPSSNK